MAPRMEGPSLDSSYAQTEALSGFHACQPSQFAKEDYASQTFSKMRNCLHHGAAKLFRGQSFFRRRPFVPEIEGERLMVLIAASEGPCDCASPTEQHQRFINGYARQPR